jgi:hypothetical protein
MQAHQHLLEGNAVAGHRASDHVQNPFVRSPSVASLPGTVNANPAERKRLVEDDRECLVGHRWEAHKVHSHNCNAEGRHWPEA